MTFKAQKKRTDFALVTVATGEGLISTFKEMGADVVLDGGQGKNPSIEDFINAFDEVNADNIFVLPNNSNIIMAAKQASTLYQNSKVFLIESKNMGQAYSALSMLDYSSNDANAIASQIESDMQSSVTGMVTVAVRDACIDGVDIKENSYIGFVDKKMLTSKESKVETALSLCEKLSLSDKCFLIAVYGKGVLDTEREELSSLIQSNYPNVEFYEIDGKQDVYDFLLIME